MLTDYICALDIGSSKISAVVCGIKRKRITNIFFNTVPSKGIKRGAVIDSIELVGCIGRILKNLKVKSGINIKFIYTNISGQDIVTRHSHAIIPLAERGNKVITISDIQKVNEQARILGSSLDEEIIYKMPLYYTIDSNNNISNPLGLYSHRLEVDLYLICAKLSSIQTITRVVNQAGYEIKNLFFSGIATSKVIFNRKIEEGLNLLCDIGRDITELLIFKNGLLCNIEVLALGGDDLTEELQGALKMPFDLAEDVKKSYGITGDYSQINEDKEILVKRDNIYKPIKQKLVSQIITSKTKLICQNIKDAVEKKVDLITVDNFVIAGRTILLEGFLETLENILGVPVKPGRIADPDIIPLAKKENALSGQNYLNYLTSLGIICEALKDRQPQTLPANQPSPSLILRAINRFKEVYQEYF